MICSFHFPSEDAHAKVSFQRMIKRKHLEAAFKKNACTIWEERCPLNQPQTNFSSVTCPLPALDIWCGVVLGIALTCFQWQTEHNNSQQID